MYQDDSYEYIPHKNLHDVSRISCNRSFPVNNSISSNKIFTDNINKQIMLKQNKLDNQKLKIKDLKRQIEVASNENDVKEMKNSIYDELNIISNQLSQLTEQNRVLTEENIELKNMVNNKNKLISQFQTIIEASTNKFKQMDSLNDSLRQEIQSKIKSQNDYDKIKNENNILITNLKEIKDQIGEIESEYKNRLNEKDNQINTIHNEYQSKLNEKDNQINSMENAFQNKLNEKQNQFKSMEDNYQSKLNEKDNQINTIHYDYQSKLNEKDNQLSTMENDYQSKLHEKDDQLNTMENEFQNKLDEKQNQLNNLSYEINEINNSKINESNNSQNLALENEALLSQINCLVREKEILLREKEKDHKELLEYRNIISSSGMCKRCNSLGSNIMVNTREILNNNNNRCNCNDIHYIANNNCTQKSNNILNEIIAQKEDEYNKIINRLQQDVVNRENEIDYIKKQFLSIIHDLKLENEKLSNIIFNMCHQRINKA